METERVSPSSAGLRYGLITGFLLVGYSLILYLTETSNNRALSLLSGLILVGGIVFAYKYFKQRNAGFMSYGQGLGIGSVLGLIVGLLAGAFSVFYTQYIDNTIVQKEMDRQIEEMENRGISEEQIERSIEIANMFSSPIVMIALSALLYLMGAFILSLIIAAIMKNSQPEFE